MRIRGDQDRPLAGPGLMASSNQLSQSHEGAQVATFAQLHCSPHSHAVLHSHPFAPEAQVQGWEQVQVSVLHSLVIGVSSGLRLQ
jgi:hypothetical protein